VTIYGHANPWGWHFTNLLFFAACAVLLWFLLRSLGLGFEASVFGLGLFLLSWAAAPSLARVSGRTTLVALVPLLAAMLLHMKWVTGRGVFYILGGQLLFMVSLLAKETAIACPPVFAVLGLFGNSNRKGRLVLISLLAACLTLAIYLAIRLSAVGTALSYEQSSGFGPFALKSMVVLASMVWKPWFTSLPVRLFVPCAILLLWFLPVSWRQKVLFLVMSFCLLLPVAALGPRHYLASSALVPAESRPILCALSSGLS
jgi:hypothetical protein